MTYAKRILSILLIICVLCNMAITVFASDTNSGGETSFPVDTVADEPATEDLPPDQGEDPPDVLTDENKEPSQEETAQLETNEEDTENPTETEEPSTSSETVEESSAPEESIATEESVEESSEPAYEDASAEESTEPATEADPVEEPEKPEAQITAVNGRAETKASGVSIVHCGNAINTNGTLTISYYNYLEGANKIAYIQAIEEKRINGAVAFCLAPEEGSLGTNYTKDEQLDAWNKLPSAMREAITLVMAYGYPHVSYSASAKDIYWYGNQNMLNGENYIATQLLIWEFLSGVRNSVTFELTGSTSYRNACYDGWNSIRTTYDSILTKLKNHNTLPAYASPVPGKYVYELKYDSSTKTYRYLLPTERQSDWRNCLMKLPDGITYLKKSDNMTVIGFEATVAAAEALPKDGYTVSGESPSVSVDPNKAVACWECDNSQTVATMVQKPDPAKAYFTLKLAPEGTMTAKKTSPSGDVAGYCFKFYSSATDTTWYAKTDASGNLCLSNSSYSTLGSKEFSHLPEGDYTLTEVLSKKGKDLVFPDKWTIKVTDADGKVTTKTYTSANMTKASNGDCILKNVNITGLAGGGTITMTINNVSLTERLEIKKTSPDGKIEGITFYVLDANGKEIGRDKTDKDGKINIDGLTVGQTYTVYEIVPDGYVCTQNPKQITIQAGIDKNKVSFENKPLVLKLIKESQDGNTKNISFQIFAGYDNYMSGKVWQTLSTGLDSSFTITGIPKGDYWFREVPLTGYTVQPDQKVTVTEANTENNPAVVTFVNVPIESLTIYKTSPNGNVKDIEFYVTDANGTEVGRDKTDANGKLVFPNLIVGQTYTVTEVVPNGCICEKNDQKVTIQTGTNRLTFVNTVIRDLEIIKTSPNGNVANIEFFVKDASGKEVGRDKTDANGSLVFPSLIVGQTYTVTEVVPKGYVCTDNNQQITIQTGTNTLTFENKPITLKIVKTSPDGNVEGITFYVYKGLFSYQDEQNPFAKAKTDVNGTILLGALAPDTYYVKEIVSEGYEPQKIQAVSVTTENTPDNPAIVTFTNVPRPSLKIVKESPDGNIDGISFNIYDGITNYRFGRIMQTVITTEDGTIQINNLSSSSTYYIEEIVPEGYVPQKVQTIRLTSENTPSNPANVTFVNEPIRGIISVNKVTTADTPLAGATFLLEFSTDGVTWDAVKPATEEENGIGTCSTVGEDGTLTTGEDGQAVFDGLIVYGASYRLTETVAPPGYQLLAEPVFVGEITANEKGNNYEIYRTVVNVPLLQMPPTGGDGSVRLICAIATVVASASLLGLGLMCKRRKSPESNG